MMKKVLAMFMLITVLLLAGCGQLGYYYWEDKQYREDHLEELIEDKIEEESGVDVEVNIYEETED